MDLGVRKGNHPIDLDTRNSISKRYKTITKAVNGDFWDSDSETAHSRYVGSYGRGTAIDTSEHLSALVRKMNKRLGEDVHLWNSVYILKPIWRGII